MKNKLKNKLNRFINNYCNMQVTAGNQYVHINITSCNHIDNKKCKNIMEIYNTLRNLKIIILLLSVGVKGNDRVFIICYVLIY